MDAKAGDEMLTFESDNLDDMDNLADHFNDIVVQDDPLAKIAKEHKEKGQKRRLTIEEEDELRSTQLVRKKNSKNEEKVTFEDFNFLMVIGRGTFGKVFLIEHKKTKALYACKSIRKDILIQYDQVDNTILEKDIMFECDHQFLVGMEFLF